MVDSSKFMDIYTATINFYVLEDIKSRVPTSRKSRELVEEVRYYQEEFFAPKMAKTMFDYLALTSLGELRYAYTKKANSKHVPISPPFNNLSGDSEEDRDIIYTESIKYNPKKFLPETTSIFSEKGWEKGYGGQPWAKISRRAAGYYTLSPVAFVDSVIDLTHHNGLAYSKPVLITCRYGSRESLLYFLEEKSHYRSFLEANIEHTLILCSDCMEFLERATRLLNIKLKAYVESVTANIKFPFVKWGNKTLRFRSGAPTQKKKSEQDALIAKMYSAKIVKAIEAKKIKIQTTIKKGGKTYEEEKGTDSTCQGPCIKLSQPSDMGRVS